MKPRLLLHVVLLVLTAFCVRAAERKPNIILIVTDDQGYRDLGCFGGDQIKTPNLDRIAREGVRATNFYVTWPACTPSRGSLLTGRFPQRNGLYDMVRNDMVNYGHRFTWEEYLVSPEMTLGLDPRETTIGNVLQRAGYRNAVIGKWDMGQAKRYLPLQRGFHYFYGHGNNGIDYYTHERYGVHSMFRNNERTAADKGVYATDLFRREALQFVRENASRPFFLYLPFNAPHSASNLEKDSLQVPEKWLGFYPGLDPKDKRARYMAMVSCMDDAVGELLDTLRELKLEQNTLIMFFSDNGGSGPGDNKPLRGGKSSMFEGGIRVPFLARWPERLPAGKVCDEFLTALEVFPTFCAAAGAKPPAGVKLDGHDMLPILAGKAKSPRTEMFWQRRADKAARVGNFKWADSAKHKGLYDLSVDIEERNDLSAEKPDVLARVKARFDAWRKEMDAAEPRGPFRDY
ncbi:MAG: N-acetylgalactosamine-6-sulfatase [Verrucomicrobia bacterium]|nr:N-acetylgalactosamine-6-sulfatase [Verrucomicrobiota bacterium]